MEQYSKYSDEELIQRLRAGETGIADYLIEKYKYLVRRKARAMFLIGGDTDDLIQEGMIGLFKAVRDYHPGKEASFVTFAQMCIDRQIYSAVQSSNRQKHMPLNTYISLSQEDEESPLAQAWVETPEEIIIDRENTRALEDEIKSALSPMENTVLNYYLEGKSYADIGMLMYKNPKSVDNALRRIRTKIRNYLEKKYVL
ncbi:RNA polymerase sporulation sigma factor SigH [Blautia ammoniilytica]|uniref:RNA polymerase sigma factor SigS n=1 Tax=Blautia ammoniilytica TaxID=2981782 RepID=A0ABT2TQE3_9FIRM|nr:RNA polymerase sporulation sigma factor SigH [Blautia ammoniilytica]MCU6764419.1 RNA polymerase sporulation sigma factor SigH [Blautia ammoniilytica]SCH35937.1 Stage 0 sporulation protein H [uncultured Blautia sp.]